MKRARLSITIDMFSARVRVERSVRRSLAWFRGSYALWARAYLFNEPSNPSNTHKERIVVVASVYNSCVRSTKTRDKIDSFRGSHCSAVFSTTTTTSRCGFDACTRPDDCDADDNDDDACALLNALNRFGNVGGVPKMRSKRGQAREKAKLRNDIW